MNKRQIRRIVNEAVSRALREDTDARRYNQMEDALLRCLSNIGRHATAAASEIANGNISSPTVQDIARCCRTVYECVNEMNDMYGEPADY